MAQMLGMCNNAVASTMVELLGSGIADEDQDRNRDYGGCNPWIGAREMKCYQSEDRTEGGQWKFSLYQFKSSPNSDALLSLPVQ
jgi:hypothetical protein